MANLIDRIVQYVSPSAALKREHARQPELGLMAAVREAMQ